MTTDEHLNRIVAKCRELIAADAGSKRAEAGWSATIIACERILGFNRSIRSEPRECEKAMKWVYDAMAENIIAFWPEELL